MRITKILGGTVFTEKEGFLRADLYLKDGKIEKIVPAAIDAPATRAEGEDVIDATGKYILPGMVDIHFHGCAGKDFCEGTEEAFRTIEEYELSHGITSICPATMTFPVEQVSEILSAANRYMRSKSPEENIYRGANMEGPFISREKKGAQNEAYLDLPTVEKIRHMMEASENFPKLVDIAPELPGAIECIREVSKDLVVSLAHTTADYDTACAAFDAGASHVTHLYNAMQPYSHRAPGLIGAAADKGAEVELICDGLHVHPSVVRSTFKMFGADRVILISDSMEATGMPDGQYALGGQAVFVKGHLATLENGTLAGSATNLFDCMVNAIHFGVPADQAIRAASYNPARCIGIAEDFGSIRPGKEADLLITTPGYELEKVLRSGYVRCE